MPPHLRLNMIVKNEAARIGRCLSSVIPYISSAAIVDTGSTDGTQDVIAKILGAHGIPASIGEAPFHNWAQARNAGLAHARLSNDWDYLLLCDADMELVVPDHAAFVGALGERKAYDLRQRTGGEAGVDYWNRRLVARSSTANYLGVTHEYLDESDAAQLPGPYFVDHADGSNRPDKLERDVVLLKDALVSEPLNVRYWFYLGQSYRDLGKYAEAELAYRRRVELGGWDEEVWNAHYNVAHCLDNRGEHAQFVHEMLLAWNRRPSRAETLYDLATHFRKHGNNALAAHFALAGLVIPYTKDILFISDYCYRFGLREELAISGFYQETTREQAFRACNELALDRAAPAAARENARINLFFYLKPLFAHLRHFATQRIPFEPPEGYTAMNPSIVRARSADAYSEGDGFVAIVRTVNYTISEQGLYLIKGKDDISPNEPIHTRNFLLQLSDSFAVRSVKEISEPDNMPKPQFDLVRGFEDMRLFPDDPRPSGRPVRFLRFSACLREISPEGWCDQVVGIIRETADTAEIVHWNWVTPAWKPRQHEKNWMPWRGDRLIYRLGTVIDHHGVKVSQRVPELATDHIGGGAVMSFDPGYLAIVHEARPNPFNGQRYYAHRFAHLADDGSLIALSRPFVFQGQQIEFATGLARGYDDSVVISYSVRDCEAWLGRLDPDEILAFIHAE
jgi:glycosyltransferase involved in cell wall biosynthesis